MRTTTSLLIAATLNFRLTTMDKKQASYNDILCEISTDQSCYVITSHIVGTKKGEPFDKKNLRYITLSKEKAKRFMKASAKRVKVLHSVSNNMLLIRKTTGSKIEYSVSTDDVRYIMTISMEEYYLDFAVSEF